MISDKTGDGALAPGQWLPGLAGLLGPAHQASSVQIFERLWRFDLAQTRDRLAPTSDQDIRALLDFFEVLAEPIMQLPHTNLGLCTM